jgi:hypothetical protein
VARLVEWFPQCRVYVPKWWPKIRGSAEQNRAEQRRGGEGRGMCGWMQCAMMCSTLAPLQMDGHRAEGPRWMEHGAVPGPAWKEESWRRGAR